jgi:protein TonB
MRDRQDVAVTFVKPPPPPPPPPPAAPRQSRPRPKPDQPRTVLQQAIVAPTVVPEERPPEQEPVDIPSTEGVGGIDGGEVGGVPGGIVGGVVDARDAPLEFDAQRMTEPKKLSGPDPQYTEKALEREVQGKMIVKCVLTSDGRVHACRVLKSLPFMDRAAIQALERRRYAPVTMGGRAIDVDYTFVLTLRLPD